MAAPAWRLAAPLGAFFALFFLAPLALLLVTSVQAERQMTGGLGLGQYTAFFGDTLNLVTLGSTLLVGAKATLLCLVAGYPLALPVGACATAVGGPCCCSWWCCRS